MKRSFIVLMMSVLVISVFGQTKKSVECRIWKTESFCEVPDSAKVHSSIHYRVASMLGVSCSELDKKNYIGVWVTFQGINKSKLIMKSQYKNISLIRKNKEILHPIAYMERAEPLTRYTPVFSSNKSTFEECVFELKLKGKYDLFIIFETAEVGDKLIIGGFLKAVIE